MHKCRLWLIILVFLLAAPGAAQAHKAVIQVEVKEGQVTATCLYYPDDPMKDAAFQAYDQTGMQRFEGRTDGEGKVSFPTPKGVESLKLVVRDLMGHRAELIVTKDRLDPKE